MSLLSDDKVSHLSHLILKSVKRSGMAALQGDEVKALKTIKRVLASELAQEAAIDQLVRKRLASYSRPIIEGSQEWDVMYRKCAEEELRKQIRHEPKRG